MGRQKSQAALWLGGGVGWQRTEKAVAGGCGSPSGEELGSHPTQILTPSSLDSLETTKKNVQQ